MVFFISDDGAAKPGSAHQATITPQKPPSKLVPTKVQAVCPYPEGSPSESAPGSIRPMPVPYKSVRPDGLLRPFSVEKEEGFTELLHHNYFLRRKIFLVYLIISVIVTTSALCFSVFLDTSMFQYIGLIKGQLHAIFIIVLAHCCFVLLICILGFVAAYRRCYKLLISYTILSSTLFMLVLLCIFYTLAMRHEVHIHLSKSMIHGVHFYGETPDESMTAYWDNVQTQFHCCGLYGPEDWKLSVVLRGSLPDTCCKDVTEGCGQHATAHPEYMYDTGCYQLFFDWLNVFTYEMIGIASLLVVWQILGVLSSSYLAHITHKMSRNERVELKHGCC